MHFKYIKKKNCNYFPFHLLVVSIWNLLERNSLFYIAIKFFYNIKIRGEALNYKNNSLFLWEEAASFSHEEHQHAWMLSRKNLEADDVWKCQIGIRGGLMLSADMFAVRLLAAAAAAKHTPTSSNSCSLHCNSSWNAALNAQL